MLFNSYIFIFAYLPVTLIGFFLLGRNSHRLAALWLAAASLFFYGWWDVRYVALLLGSIVLNYSAGYLISRKLTGKRSEPVSTQHPASMAFGGGHWHQFVPAGLLQIRQLLC